jgi:hypothetical protein
MEWEADEGTRVPMLVSGSGKKMAGTSQEESQSL